MFAPTPNTSTNTSTAPEMLTVCTSPESLKQEKASAPAGTRAISVTWRNPARFAGVVISAQPWHAMRAALGESGAAYAPLLDAVLETAAKAILSRRLGDMSLFPAQIQGEIFSSDAILSEATSGNTEWLDKETLTSLWKESATFKQYSSDPRGQGQGPQAKAYRKAVADLGELVCKLSGKTSQFTEKELDTILAKLHADDLDTTMGAFIVRRIDAIRNRPARQELDLDML